MLVREICNDLIMQSHKFVVGEEIFAVEPPEARGRGSLSQLILSHVVTALTTRGIPLQYTLSCPSQAADIAQADPSYTL